MTAKPNHLVAAIVLAVATVICFWRLSLHPADLLVGPQGGGNNDLTRYYLPAREHQGEALATRHMSPCWDPFILAGTPWFGNPQAGLLYPLNWSYAFIPARLLISWMMVTHHWWAGVGTYFLSRRYGLRWSSSVFAGLCFLGAPYLLAQSGEGHYAQICLVAWTPFAFLGVERIRAGQRGGTALTVTVLALCFFCGHVQEVFYLVLLLTAYLAPDLAKLVWRRPGAASSLESEPRVAIRLLGRWALVGLAVAGLTAIELLPTWVYSRNSIRAGGMEADHIRNGVLGMTSLIQLVDPFALGGPTDYWGPGRFYCETLCCFGIPALGFGLVAVCWGFRRRPVLRFAVLWLVGLIFAFGDQTPLFPVLHRLVPGVSLFRNPSRMLFFCSFFAAMLAGAGFDHLQSLTLDGRRRWRCLLAVAGACLLCLGGSLLLWRWLTPEPKVTEATRLALSRWATIISNAEWGISLAAIAAVLFVMWLLATSAPKSRCAVVLGLSLVGISSAWYAGGMLRTIPPGSAGRDNPAIEFLRVRLGTDRVLVEQDLLSDREARRYGIQKVQGYDPVPLGRVALYAVALIPKQDPAMGLPGFEHLRLSALRKPLVDALGVRYAVVPGSGPEEVAGWRRVSRGVLRQEFALRGQTPMVGQYTIYENLVPMPRAFVLGHAQPRRPDLDAVQQLAEIDHRRAVLLERDVLPPGPHESFRPAEVVEYTASRVIVRAALDAPGYLVLSDSYYPGWSAWIDGRPATVMPANLAFRAVALERGRHTIEFRCTPPCFTTGAFISALTVVGLILGFVRKSDTKTTAPSSTPPV